MRKLFILLAGCVICSAALAQTPTMQQKLFYTCKVWGFVKYYHSEVSTCQVNWDSVLLHTLPLVESATTSNAFNDALDTMLLAAGPMALATTYFPDTIASDLKRNRDWSWISTPLLRSDVQIQLDTIKNNFRPHGSCWVVNNHSAGTINHTGGWLAFPHDSIGINVNTVSTYPDAYTRLLMFYKCWNIVKYFNPYNYVLDTSIETILFTNAIKVYNTTTPQALAMLYLKIGKELDDAHTYSLTYNVSYYIPPNGFYQPKIRLKYCNGKYVVIKSQVTGIVPGDAVLTVDGLTTNQWEDSLRPYYSAGNMSVFRRLIATNLLNHYNGFNTTLTIENISGSTSTFNLPCNAFPDTFKYNWYYPADSLSSISWTKLNCNTGYINIGNIDASQTNDAYINLRSSTSIIVDLRNYPKDNSPWLLGALMYPHPIKYAKLTMPDVNYPGTFFWEYDSLRTDANPTPYTGKVIILINEQTQSAAEYSSMMFAAMPGSIKVGSQTAGADGNITYWFLSQDVHFGFSNLGVFYPNGDSTQRIGIVPDSIVYPSRQGIRDHIDEVLNKALAIAGCDPYTRVVPLAGEQVINVFPNPVDEIIYVEATNNINQISITNLIGQLVYSRSYNSQTVQINVANLPNGIYFLKINGNVVRRFIKE